jgi:predicted membrane chloride channel (bestrophin family)
VTLIASLNEILTGTERVLDTPLPAAYSIAIAQISWIYVMLLPFQLYKFLKWTTIPASMGKWLDFQDLIYRENH